MAEADEELRQIGEHDNRQFVIDIEVLRQLTKNRDYTH
jgi:hypothetical protein